LSFRIWPYRWDLVSPTVPDEIGSRNSLLSELFTRVAESKDACFALIDHLLHDRFRISLRDPESQPGTLISIPDVDEEVVFGGVDEDYPFDMRDVVATAEQQNEQQKAGQQPTGLRHE
jgi:hypothetical protein